LRSGKQDDVKKSYLSVAKEFLEAFASGQIDDDCFVEPSCTKTQAQKYNVEADGDYDVVEFLKEFPHGINAKTIQDCSLFVLGDHVTLLHAVKKGDKNIATCCASLFHHWRLNGK
jgi:hypothetical protein